MFSIEFIYGIVTTLVIYWVWPSRLAKNKLDPRIPVWSDLVMLVPLLIAHWTAWWTWTWAAVNWVVGITLTDIALAAHWEKQLKPPTPLDQHTHQDQ